ncbi:hypothetical protein ABE288_09530 [Bacillus salipaludis]|uniref:hypothetical protein n=1 Tax=Bacillus salipaludis TaxID=2547811 RepID=UPI003D1A9B95
MAFRRHEKKLAESLVSPGKESDKSKQKLIEKSEQDFEIKVFKYDDLSLGA